MKIHFERTGGFAGINIRSTIDTATLSLKEAEQVRKWIEEASFFNLPDSITGTTPGADQFQYKLTVEDRERSKSCLIGERSIPEGLRALIQYLLGVARKE